MTKPQLLTPADVQKRFDSAQYDILNILEDAHVVLFEGGTVVTETMNHAWANALLTTQFPEAAIDAWLIIVNGNLTVTGDIDLGEYQPLLLVIGNVTCDVLISSNDTVVITGDAHIKHAFHGYYNDGTIQIAGTTHVPYVINDNHNSEINAPDAICINVFDDSHDFFDYDYMAEGLSEVVVPEVLNDGAFDTQKFIAWVRAGKTPFVAGARSLKVAKA